MEPLDDTGGSPTSGGNGLMPRVGVWSADRARAEAYAGTVVAAGCTPIVLDSDVSLASAGYRQTIDVLLAEDDERLAAQREFIRVPLILVHEGAARADARLAGRAYATVADLGQLALILDRFLEHRALADNAAARQTPPTRCSRCSRPFERLGGHHEGEERFVRFGSVALCAGCVSALRRLIRASDRPLVEADARSAA